MDIWHVSHRLLSIDVEKTLIQILNKPKTEEFIVRLNTRVQLYKEGIDSEGKTLVSIGGNYAPSTVRKKKRKSQPTNRVTLYDSGEFYDSFTVTPTANADYTIDSDPMKNGKSLFKRWGENVEGLTDENAEKVIDYLRVEFYKIAFRGLR